MLRMVAGFLFCESLSADHVLLIEKAKPVWQAGLLNGVGGKIEDGEVSGTAMVREFQEETGLDSGSWQHFATETGRDYVVDFYRMRATPMLAFAHLDGRKSDDEREMLRWVPMYLLHNRPVVGNLHWLIPMAQDWRRLHAAVDVRMDDIRERASW